MPAFQPRIPSPPPLPPFFVFSRLLPFHRPPLFHYVAANRHRSLVAHPSEHNRQGIRQCQHRLCQQNRHTNVANDANRANTRWDKEHERPTRQADEDVLLKAQGSFRLTFYYSTWLRVFPPPLTQLSPYRYLPTPLSYFSLSSFSLLPSMFMSFWINDAFAYTSPGRCKIVTISEIYIYFFSLTHLDI